MHRLSWPKFEERFCTAQQCGHYVSLRCLHCPALRCSLSTGFQVLDPLHGSVGFCLWSSNTHTILSVAYGGDAIVEPVQPCLLWHNYCACFLHDGSGLHVDEMPE